MTTTTTTTESCEAILVDGRCTEPTASDSDRCVRHSVDREIITLTTDISGLTSESNKRNMRPRTNVFGRMLRVTQKAPGEPVVVEAVDANGFRLDEHNPDVIAMFDLPWAKAIETLSV